MQTRAVRSDPLRVALVAPPWYSLPPSGYGGTELVVYLLARELQQRGHSVTVFGSESPPGDLNLIALAPSGWAEDLGTPNQRFRIGTYLHRVYSRLRPGQFDVVHDHTEATGPLLASMLRLDLALLATAHSVLEEPQVQLYEELGRQVQLVAISDSQRERAPHLNWVGTVHNAIDEKALTFSREKDDYLVQLGRITPDKGQQVAIQVARRLGVRLVLAGKVDPDQVAQEYFEHEIKPHLDAEVTWIPNVSGNEKATLLARARAMLFPLDWEEPFGIAIVEAMASGTPVIGFRRGAAPELIEDGLTGFVVDDVDQMVAACERVGEIDPEACARRARQRFNPQRMAAEYEAIYLRAVGGRSADPAGPTELSAAGSSENEPDAQQSA